jgi:hypothetical protein
VTITTKTRSLPRVTFPPSLAKTWHVGVPELSQLTSVGDYTVYPTASLWQPTQETTSFRTDAGSHGDVDPLSKEERRDFADTAGNGFAGEFTSVVADKDRDNGHAFFTSKTSFSLSHKEWDRWCPTSQAGQYHRYRGPLIPRVDLWNSLYPPVRKISNNDISYFGARAIADSAPTAPQASLATAIGELLQEGIPALIAGTALKERISRIRSSGDEYLNIQFGWLPLVSEVRSLVLSLQKRSKMIRQFERDGGKRVRRRWNLPEITSSQTEEKISVGGPALMWFYTYPDFFRGNGGVQPRRVLRETYTSKVYSFSGQFQYAVVKGKTFSDKLLEFEQKADFLLGASLNPETLWNMTPWSWLADWAFNIGDILANASYLSSDGLVMRYGYLMCHTRETNRFYIPDFDITFWGDAKPGTISASFTRESKERVRATPYGFALNPTGFTDRQWAILGALGLTRAPKSLP